MIPRTHPLTLALTLLPFALAACSTPDRLGPNREALAAALGELDEDEYAAAAARLAPIVEGGAAPAGPLALQRFFATYLLAEAHERAAYGAPFLEGPVSRPAFQMAAAEPEREPSRVAHLVATAYHAHLGRRIFAALEAQPPRAVDAGVRGEDEGAALPDDLERLGPETALLSLNLSLLGVYSRLDFRERVEEIVEGIPALADVGEHRRILDEADVESAVRPWIHRAVFVALRKRDEPCAYRFGVLALEAARGREGALTEEAREDIVQWITEGSSYEFRSPAGQIFDPALPGCTITGTPNIEFEAHPRAPGG